MIIRGIQFEGGVPVRVTADLTLEELAWIAGQAEETRGAGVASDLYDATTGELFNRYWDAGLPGYQRGDETS